jgi:SOS-response transcriptional repressor LexA
MHPTQQKILNLAASIQINKCHPRIIAKLIEVEHPQNVAHHIEQLEKRGYISIDSNGVIKVKKQGDLVTGQLFQLPIYGSANAGPATIFAEENLQGYLAVPSSEIGRNSRAGIFIVIVDGTSLNNAQDLKGGPAETGDYAVIDGNNRTPNNDQYVLSIIDGMANLKRFHRDEENRRIILSSESTMETKPIYIQEEHFDDYMINGVVLEIIKRKIGT